MNGRTLWVMAAVLVAAVAAWLGASELPAAARLLTVALVALLPALLLGQSAIDEDEASTLPTIGVYVSSMIMILGIGAASLWAGLSSGMRPADLGLRAVNPAAGLLWTGALVVGALALMAAWRSFGGREAPLLERLLPRTTAERSVFVLLSLSAGIGEEIAFRGFLIPALETASGSRALAVVVSSLAFGMLHSYQRTGGVIRASTLGALLAIPLLVTGSLIPSIVAHALVDLIAGLLLADWLLRSPDDGTPRQKH